MIEYLEEEIEQEDNDMKVRMEFEGDLFENKEDITIILNAYELMHVIEEVRSHINDTLNHDENISEEETLRLEDILAMLYVEGLDL